MTSYTYTTGIPNPTDTPANDVSDMQTNTNSINSIWETDHVGFNSTGPTMTGTGGMHLQCQFCGSNVPSNPPSFPTLFVNTQDGNSHSLPNSIAQLFFYSGSSTVSSSQYYIQSGNQKAGSSFLMGGIIIKWAVVTLSAGFDQDISFTSLGLPNFPNNFFCVVANINTSTVTPDTATLTVQTYVNNTSSFHVKTSSTSKISTINVIAIGN